MDIILLVNFGFLYSNLNLYCVHFILQNDLYIHIYYLYI